MKYMGSKSRVAKNIIEIARAGNEGRVWVEPFVGGANMIAEVEGERIGADNNRYVAAMWRELEAGWVPKQDYTKEFYERVRRRPETFPAHLVGWLGICCSYCGKWFGGYAGEVATKGGVRDYQKEAHRNVMKQVPKIKGVEFHHSGYDTLDIPPESLIYCDPPYRGTTGYKDSFDHDSFWEWCRDMKSEGHAVYVSEYQAPTGIECVWERGLASSLAANGTAGGSKLSTERLFKV